MPWHVAFEPSKKLPRCRPGGLAPQITKFQAVVMSITLTPCAVVEDNAGNKH